MNIFYNEPKYTAEELIADFRKFVIYAWWHLNLPRPTRMQIEIAGYLQEGHKRMQLQALRGIGKTWLTGAFVVWRLLRNPNERVLIVSQTGTHAEAIAIFTRRLIGLLPITEHLVPRVDQRDSTLAFEVNGCEVAVQPSVKALGIEGQMQGNRATLLISDDVEGQKNSATEQMRTKLAKYTAEYEAILQTDADSQIIILGTPQSAESIYKGFKEDGYVTRMYPARYPEDISVYDGCLADYIVEAMMNDSSLVGKPIDSRFTDEDLINREARYGRSGFKLQFMLDTTLSDAEKYPLKLHDLIVMPLDYEQAPTKVVYGCSSTTKLDISNVGFRGDGFYAPSFVNDEYAPYEGVYMGIDPSGKGKDASAYCVIAHLHGKLYLLEAGGILGHGYNTEALTKFAQVAMKYKVNKLWIESNFGDSMFTTLLTPVMNAIYPVAIEDIRHSTQKELRIIDTLEPVINQHRLIVDKGLVDRDVAMCGRDNQSHIYSLFYQMTHITKDKGSLLHDDTLDVVAMVVAQWQRILIQNPMEALEQHKARQKDKAINKFISDYKKANPSMASRELGMRARMMNTGSRFR